MEHCVILFAANLSEYAFLPEFSGLSALDRSLLWAKNDSKSSKTVIFTSPALQTKVESAVKKSGIDNAVYETSDSWTNALIAEKTSSVCEKTGTDFALFAFADSPFLNMEESLKIISTHTEYKAEYTFADGWPLSLTPVAVDAGAAKIIAELGKTSQKSAGEKSSSRTPFWDIMAGDINSFEIEAEIAQKDFRLYRFDFSCSNKLNFLSCKNLFDFSSSLFAPDGTYDILSLSEAAEKNPAVLQSLPSFFEIQS